METDNFWKGLDVAFLQVEESQSNCEWMEQIVALFDEPRLPCRRLGGAVLMGFLAF